MSRDEIYPEQELERIADALEEIVGLLRTKQDGIPPGFCGAPYPDSETPYRCELLAGHDGMHQFKDWRHVPPGQLGSPQITAWTGWAKA